MCLNRWAWIKEAIAYENTLTSHDISVKAVHFAEAGISNPEDRLINIIEKKYKKQGIDYKRLKVELPRANWKELFLRLDLEDFLLHIDMNPDFSAFYEKLEVCRLSKISTLLIPVIQINNIKSGFHYLTALLSRLTSLKYLEFTGLPQMHNMIS